MATDAGDAGAQMRFENSLQDVFDMDHPDDMVQVTVVDGVACVLEGRKTQS